jgi:hypothetical protein
MTVFRLPTLALSSGFESPVGAVSVPAEIVTGADPALAVVEGAYRPEGTVCRFVQPHGLVALRIAEPVPDLFRVVLVIRSDRPADERWSERVTRIADARAVRGVDRDRTAPLPDPTGRTRAVAIRVQGRPRGEVLLVNDGTEDGWTRQRLVLDVPGDSLESGLLLLGFETSDAAGDSGLDDPLVGACLTRLRVRAADQPGRPSVSTGLLDEDGWMPYRTDVGAVVTPPATAPFRLLVRQDRAAGRRGLLRRPGGAGDQPKVTATGVDGTALTVPAPTVGDDGIAAYQLPGDAGPLRVRVTGTDGAIWLSAR